MLRGLRFETDCFEFRLDVDGSASDSTGATCGVIGTLETSYLNSYLVRDTGIALAASRGFAPNGYGGTLSIPFLDISETRTFLVSSSVAVRFRLLGLKIFSDTTGVYKLKCNELVWILNGSTEWSGGPLTVLSSIAICPGAIPLMGIMPFSGADVIVPNVLASSPTGGIGSGAFTASGSAGVTAGWRFLDKDGSTWRTSKIDLDAPSVPSGILVPSAADCWSVDVPAEGYNTCNGTTLGSNHRQVVTCGIWPSDESGNIKLDTFESIFLRGDLPKVEAKVVDTFFDSNPPPVGTSTDDSFFVTVYDTETQFLERVTNSPSTIEGPITLPNYAPWESHDYLETITSSNITRIHSGYQLGPFVSSDALTPLNHLDAIARYWNSRNHRHPAFFPWFPPDASDTTVRWDLQGADAPIDYWYGCRQLHIDHPALPSETNTKHRVNDCADVITQNGLLGLCGTYLGMPCWAGIDGFSIKERDYPDHFITDETSEPRFSFLDGVSAGTGSVDSSGVTLDVGDSILFALDSYEDWPRMAPSLADRLTVTSADANFGGCNIFLRGYDDSEVLLGSTTGEHRIVRGPSTEWASSAVFDFGQGELADTYSGIAPSDGSTGIQDIARATSFGLLPGFSGEFIRIEIARVNPANPVSIDHLRFDMPPWEDAKAFYETGGLTTILFKDGPMARFGALSFYDYFLDTPISTPILRGMSGAPTLGDLWAWENCFLRGIDAQTGIFTRLQAEFIENEEFTIADHAWRDPDGIQTTISGVWNSEIGPVFWYLNSYRCHFSLSWCGEKKRESADGWQPTGEPGQYKYHLTTPQFPVIVPGSSRAKLVDEDSNDVLSTVSSPSGWSVGSFTSSTNGSEAYDWTIRWNDVDWLSVRPWRGFSNIFGYEESGRALDYAVSRSQKHAWALEKDGQLLVKQNDNNFTLWLTYNAGDACDVVKIAWDSSSNLDRLWLLTITDGVLELRHSLESLDSWSTVIATWSADMADLAWSGNNLLYNYYIDGGDLRAKVFDAQMNLVRDLTTNVSSIDSDSFLGMDLSIKDGKQRVTVTYTSGGTPLVMSSFDHINFT